jgi:hypothetical protein
MKRQIWTLVSLFTLILMGLLLGATLVAAEAPEEPGTSIASPDTTALAYTYNTVITVTSGTDPNDSKSETCYTGTSTDRSPCTLRRAIVESRSMGGGELPVLIRFDIPQNAGEGYDSSLGIWEIEVYNTTDLYAFRRLKGQVIIDGDTQPGGRAEGPKIFVIGPGTGQKTGFVVGDVAGDDEIIIRGLGLQNFKTHMSINTDDNLIEDCWFGLSTDGTTLTSGDISEPEGGSAIGMTSGSDRNIIRNNRFTGFFGAAVAIRGNTHEFSGNWIGMRADGTVPIPAQFDSHPCDGSSTWTGGSGITIEGDDHQIGGPDAGDGNRFAGLYLDLFATSEQPFAMQFTGSTEDVLVQNNVIGLDGNDDPIGICGRGLKLSNGPLGTQVISNTFVETGLSAILMNHWTLNGNTLRGNTIKRTGAWPEEQGDNTFPEDAIAYGGGVPQALRSFQPAVVTEIDGTSVTGVSGTSQHSQACAYCTIELFRDDTDTVTEALQSLVTVTADGSGNWTATLPAPLADGQGLRTMSTVPDEWTIDDLDAGTTSNLSPLYGNDFKIYLPLILR